MAKDKFDWDDDGDWDEDAFFDSFDDLEGDLKENKKDKPGIVTFFKNSLKSLGRGTVKIGKNFLPELFDTAENFATVGREVKDAVSDKKDNMMNEISKATGGKSLSAMFSGEFAKMRTEVLDNWKQGIFVKGEEQMSLDDLFGDEDEEKSNEDDEYSTSHSEEEKKEEYLSDYNLDKFKPNAMPAEAMSKKNITNKVVIQKVDTEGSKRVIKATLGTAEASIKAQEALFNKASVLAEGRHRQNLNYIRNMAKNLYTLVAMTGTSFRAQIEYGRKQLAMSADLLGLTKELHQFQTKLYGKALGETDAFGNSTMRATKSDIFGNTFSGSAYAERLQENFGDFIMSSPLGMLLESSTMLKEMGSSMGGKKGMGGMLKQMIKPESIIGSMIFGDRIKQGFEMFNKLGSSIPALINSKLVNLAQKDGILGAIGEIFGIKDTAGSLNFSKKAASRDLKSPAIFDQRTWITLNEIIPGHLSAMRAALTGQEQTYYDHKTMQFKGVSQLEKEYKQQLDYNYYSDFDVQNSMERITNNATVKGSEAGLSPSEVKKGIDLIYKQIVDIGLEFDAKRATKDKSYRKLLTSKLDGFSPEKKEFLLNEFLMAFASMESEAKYKFNLGIMAAQGDVMDFRRRYGDELYDSGQAQYMKMYEEDTTKKSIERQLEETQAKIERAENDKDMDETKRKLMLKGLTKKKVQLQQDLLKESQGAVELINKKQTYNSEIEEEMATTFGSQESMMHRIIKIITSGVPVFTITPSKKTIKEYQLIKNYMNFTAEEAKTKRKEKEAYEAQIAQDAFETSREMANKNKEKIMNFTSGIAGFGLFGTMNKRVGEGLTLVNDAAASLMGYKRMNQDFRIETAKDLADKQLLQMIASMQGGKAQRISRNLSVLEVIKGDDPFNKSISNLEKRVKQMNYNRADIERQIMANKIKNPAALEKFDKEMDEIAKEIREELSKEGYSTDKVKDKHIKKLAMAMYQEKQMEKATEGKLEDYSLRSNSAQMDENDKLLKKLYEEHGGKYLSKLDDDTLNRLAAEILDVDVNNEEFLKTDKAFRKSIVDSYFKSNILAEKDLEAWERKEKEKEKQNAARYKKQQAERLEAKKKKDEERKKAYYEKKEANAKWEKDHGEKWYGSIVSDIKDKVKRPGFTKGAIHDDGWDKVTYIKENYSSGGDQIGYVLVLATIHEAEEVCNMLAKFGFGYGSEGNLAVADAVYISEDYIDMHDDASSDVDPIGVRIKAIMEEKKQRGPGKLPILTDMYDVQDFCLQFSFIDNTENVAKIIENKEKTLENKIKNYHKKGAKARNKRKGSNAGIIMGTSKKDIEEAQKGKGRKRFIGPADIVEAIENTRKSMITGFANVTGASESVFDHNGGSMESQTNAILNAGGFGKKVGPNAEEDGIEKFVNEELEILREIRNNIAELKAGSIIVYSSLLGRPIKWLKDHIVSAYNKGKEIIGNIKEKGLAAFGVVGEKLQAGLNKVKDFALGVKDKVKKWKNEKLDPHLFKLGRKFGIVFVDKLTEEQLRDTIALMYGVPVDSPEVQNMPIEEMKDAIREYYITNISGLIKAVGKGVKKKFTDIKDWAADKINAAVKTLKNLAETGILYAWEGIDKVKKWKNEKLDPWLFKLGRKFGIVFVDKMTEEQLRDTIALMYGVPVDSPEVQNMPIEEMKEEIREYYRKFIMDKIKGIGGAIKRIPGNIVKGIKDLGNKVLDKLGFVGDLIRGGINKAKQWKDEKLDPWLQKIKDKFGMNFVKRIPEEQLRKIVARIYGLTPDHPEVKGMSIEEMRETVFEYYKENVMNKQKGGIKNVLGAIGQFGKNVFNGAKNMIGSFFGGLNIGETFSKMRLPNFGIYFNKPNIVQKLALQNLIAIRVMLSRKFGDVDLTKIDRSITNLDKLDANGNKKEYGIVGAVGRLFKNAADSAKKAPGAFGKEFVASGDRAKMKKLSKSMEADGMTMSEHGDGIREGSREDIIKDREAAKVKKQQAEMHEALLTMAANTTLMNENLEKNNKLTEKYGKLGDGGGGVIAGLMGMITAWFGKNMKDRFKNFISNFFKKKGKDVAKDKVKKGLLSRAKDSILKRAKNTKMGKAFTKAAEMGKNVINGIKNVGTKLGNTKIGKFAKNAINGIKNVGKGIGTKLGNTKIGKFAKNAISKFSSVKNAISGAKGKIIGKAKDLGKTLLTKGKDVLKSVGSKLGGKIKNVATALAGKIQALFKKLLEMFFKNKTIAQKVGQKNIGNISKTILNAVKKLAGPKLTALASKIGATLGLISTGIGAIPAFVWKVAEATLGFFSAMKNAKAQWGVGNSTKLTPAMLITSGLVGALDGLLYGVLSITGAILGGLTGSTGDSLGYWLQLIYKILSGGDVAHLTKAQNYTKDRASKIYGIEDSQAFIQFENAWIKSAGRMAKLLGFKDKKAYEYWYEHRFKPIKDIEEKLMDQFGGKKVCMGMDGDGNEEARTKYQEAFVTAALKYIKANRLEWCVSGISSEDVEKHTKEQKYQEEKDELIAKDEEGEDNPGSTDEANKISQDAGDEPVEHNPDAGNMKINASIKYNNTTSTSPSTSELPKYKGEGNETTSSNSSSSTSNNSVGQGRQAKPLPEHLKTARGMIALVVKNEGGYVNDPADSGGPTKYGIAWNYQKERLRKYGITSPSQMPDLPLDVAVEIYYENFYKAVGADKITDPVLAMHAFDMAVNAGVGRVSPWVKEALKHPCPRDWFIQRRYNYYRSIVKQKPHLSKFLNGWLKRIKHTNDALGYVYTEGSVQDTTIEQEKSSQSSTSTNNGGRGGENYTTSSDHASAYGGVSDRTMAGNADETSILNGMGGGGGSSNYDNLEVSNSTQVDSVNSNALMGSDGSTASSSGTGAKGKVKGGSGGFASFDEAIAREIELLEAIVNGQKEQTAALSNPLLALQQTMLQCAELLGQIAANSARRNGSPENASAAIASGL